MFQTLSYFVIFMQWFTSNKDTLAVCGNEVGLNSGAAW